VLGKSHKRRNTERDKTAHQDTFHRVYIFLGKRVFKVSESWPLCCIAVAAILQQANDLKRKILKAQNSFLQLYFQRLSLTIVV